MIFIRSKDQHFWSMYSLAKESIILSFRIYYKSIFPSLLIQVFPTSSIYHQSLSHNRPTISNILYTFLPTDQYPYSPSLYSTLYSTLYSISYSLSTPRIRTHFPQPICRHLYICISMCSPTTSLPSTITYQERRKEKMKQSPSTIYIRGINDDI